MLRKVTFALFVIYTSFLWLPTANAITTLYKQTATPSLSTSHSLLKATIAKQLGWVVDLENRCGGYYLEPAFIFSEDSAKNNRIEIVSDQALFSVHGTSTSQGKATITRLGQQIIANQAFIYRDPVTGKVNAIDLKSNVILRAPDDMIVAHYGHYDLANNHKTLHNLFYRTALNHPNHKLVATDNVSLQREHKITQLSAWGKAKDFSQTQPNIYQFQQVSYSTCPPTQYFWKFKASSLELNKDTGRGEAHHARIYIRKIPVFYTPYLNFPIDHRRQTGFLVPTFGVPGNLGPFFSLPFYWNLAPNYDTTITPSYSDKHGIQLTNLSRYLTASSSGEFKISILPHDKQFDYFQIAQQEIFQSSTDPAVLTNLHRLESASSPRGAVSWQNRFRFNEKWTSKIDYNYVTDDYYLKDFGGNNLNEVTQNQLLQQADVNYQAEHWDFTGRIQQYQTLHPVDEATVFANQYSRLPQLILEGDYPDQAYGLDYFVSNDFTHFDIHNNPGQSTQPMGNRLNIQPGIMLPHNWSFFSVTPRLQYALTRYELGHVQNNNQKIINRGIPIFDVSSNFYFDRDTSLFNRSFRQTLEPQAYYTYIPNHTQNRIPIFDTSVNTLTYDQLFAYNRFSSIDRINDANQISVGITTRFIDQQTGLEKVRAGIGQIIYFQPRKVALCDDSSCLDNPFSANNTRRQSPISGVLNYTINPTWSLASNTIWNMKTTRTDNQTITLSYKPDVKRTLNFGYSFVRNGDILPGDIPDTSASNLRQSDISFAWPVTQSWSAVGRWNQNWNHRHFQDFLYGLQYDSCCWAMRFVAGRAFAGLNTNNTYQYNNQLYVQFALKGLGSIGSGDPTRFLSDSISGYSTPFGEDF